MSLLAKLEQDLKTAQKARMSERVNVLRFLLAQIHNRVIALRSAGKNEELTDGQVLEVLQSEVKKRKEAINLFRQGKRNDLVAKEEKDLQYIEPYLPAQISPREIQSVINRLHAAGHTEFNPLMREAMKELKGQAEGELVRDLIQAKLGGSL